MEYSRNLLFSPVRNNCSLHNMEFSDKMQIVFLEVWTYKLNLVPKEFSFVYIYMFIFTF